MKISLFFIAVITIVMISCSTASNTIAVTAVKSVNVKKYGETAPKIWTPLTPVEMAILTKAENNFDNETQLIMALFFTGNTSDEAEVDKCLTLYRNFIAICDKELSTITDINAKGEKLHELFFRQFIGTPHKKGSPSSGVSGLLIKKEYDTNTASLLFAIVAEKYGFLPVISLTEGDTTEITSKNTNLPITVFSGNSYLELKHKSIFSSIQVFPFIEKGYAPFINMDFFDNLHKSNPEMFAEPEIEFKHYYKRKPFSLKEALLSQYKTDKDFESADSELSPFNKRIEMAAALTDSCEILTDRVWAWRNIYSFIYERKKSGELLAFIDTISAELDRTGNLCGDDARFTDLAWDLYLSSAFEYANAVNGAKMKETVRSIYKYFSTSSDDYDKRKSWLSNAIRYYLDKVIKTGIIEKELENAVGIIDAIPENEIRVGIAASFYYQAGEYYFKKKDHWRAGQFYADCAFTDDSSYRNVCIQKGISELYKYAEDSLDRKICATAADARDKCLDKIPDKAACKKITDLYNRNCNN